MKTVLRFHALTFCLFLFAFTTTTTLARELLDADGNFLRNGGSYYIVPAFRGKGGGLELARTGSETCPRTVVQAPSEQSRGLPTRLSTPPRIRYLGPEFYLTIEFEEQKPPSCLRDSNLQWKVEEESQIVKIASKEEEQLFGSFQIKPYRDDYKLVYCEPEQGGRNLECKDLGISIDEDNNRRLAVKKGDPLVVQFVNADSEGNYARMSIV